MDKQVYLLRNIEEYGKFIAFCIDNDICVFRTYWNYKNVGSVCYRIDWREKRCFYSSLSFWKNEGYEILIPNLQCDQYGTMKICDTIPYRSND